MRWRLATRHIRHRSPSAWWTGNPSRTGAVARVTAAAVLPALVPWVLVECEPLAISHHVDIAGLYRCGRTVLN